MSMALFYFNSFFFLFSIYNRVRQIPAYHMKNDGRYHLEGNYFSGKSSQRIVIEVRKDMRRKETIGYKIRLIHNQIHKRMEAKKREGGDDLTGMQRWTMAYLMEHDGEDIYQRDIESGFSVSRATASNMLQVMERKGLIERVSVEHDARLKKLVLTQKAKDMMEQAERGMREMELLLKKGMTEEEVTQLLSYLTRILWNLGIQKEDEKFCFQEKKGKPAEMGRKDL